jgi:hypothetical protein
MKAAQPNFGMISLSKFFWIDRIKKAGEYVEPKAHVHAAKLAMAKLRRN